MLRCIHCGCDIATAGTDKCPGCDERPYPPKKMDCDRNAAQEPILRTKEEKEGWRIIRKMDNI